MKTVRSLAHTAAMLLLWAGNVSAQTTNTNSTPTGDWDFNKGDLKAKVGADLEYLGQTAAVTTFETSIIGDATANVMRFPTADSSQGYIMRHGAQPNGGGKKVNLYTIVMDLMWPADSDGTYRALFTTDTNNVNDATIFINPDNGVGVNNQYEGFMQPEQWYRLALVFNLTNGTVTKYLNGERVLNGDTTAEPQYLGDNLVDSRYSPGPTLLLFTDNDGDTRSGLVDRIQFYGEALTDAQVAALGQPIGDGGPVASGDVKIDSIHKVGSDVVIAVSGGGTLQLQRKAKLTDTSWQAAGQVTGSGTFTVPATDPTAFFRVQRMP